MAKEMCESESSGIAACPALPLLATSPQVWWEGARGDASGKLSSSWGHNTVLRARMLSKEPHVWETLQFSTSDCYLSSQCLSQSPGRFAEIKAS